jgi:hypothetical protein
MAFLKVNNLNAFISVVFYSFSHIPVPITRVIAVETRQYLQRIPRLHRKTIVYKYTLLENSFHDFQYVELPLTLFMVTEFNPP